MNKIGFVGLGVMGASMVRHLLTKYDVYVYNRTAAKTAPLVEAGAIACATVQQVAEQVDVVITMVGYPSDVEDVYFGEHGIIAHAKKGTYIVDMTTSTPTLAKKIAAAAKERGLHAVDAPVSGGDIGARNATLAIMVGGERDEYEALMPIWQTLGQTIRYQGEAGAGQHTKMCNQIAIATNMIGVCEALVYGKNAGLQLKTVLETITTGAAGSWSLTNLAPRILQSNFDPGFFVKHFIKDMGIALEEAKQMGLTLPGLALAKQMYEEIAAQGCADLGTQSLVKWYNESV